MLTPLLIKTRLSRRAKSKEWLPLELNFCKKNSYFTEYLPLELCSQLTTLFSIYRHLEADEKWRV